MDGRLKRQIELEDEMSRIDSRIRDVLLERNELIMKRNKLAIEHNDILFNRVKDALNIPDKRAYKRRSKSSTLSD